MPYWLMKSEPAEFSFDDLLTRTQQTEAWDGVRNYQVRNWLRDDMQVGDRAFFYHSNCREPGIVGIMEIVRAGYPDPTALDPHHPRYDPAGCAERPRWFCVDVRAVQRLTPPVSLQMLKTCSELADFTVLQRGNRLSIVPVSAAHWSIICGLKG